MSPRPMLAAELRIVTGGGEVGVAAAAELLAVRAIGTATAAIAATPERRWRHRRAPFRGGYEARNLDTGIVDLSQELVVYEGPVGRWPVGPRAP